MGVILRIGVIVAAVALAWPVLAGSGHELAKTQTQSTDSGNMPDAAPDYGNDNTVINPDGDDSDAYSDDDGGDYGDDQDDDGAGDDDGLPPTNQI